MDQKARSSVPPAKGLRRLTWFQVEQVDACVDELCASGDGTVVIEVTRSRPLFVSVSRRRKLVPARGG